MNNVANNEMSEAREALEAILSYRFRDPQHLETALAHPSYTHMLSQGKEQPVDSNQRFEFLGDAVLSLVVSTILLKRYPEAREGDLSKLRARLVCEPTLARLGLHWGVDRYLKLSQGEESQGGRKKPSVLADAVEALIGAVYLDGGMESAITLITGVFEKLSELGGSTGLAADWKSRLQEFTQKDGGGILPEYTVLSSEGPDHAKVFSVQCRVNGAQATGTGASKKAAEQDAARQVLTAISDQSKDWEL